MEYYLVIVILLLLFWYFNIKHNNKCIVVEKDCDGKICNKK